MNEAQEQDYIRTIELQHDLLQSSLKVIRHLHRERDEAIRNLKTASEQWDVWRKQVVDKHGSL